MLPWYDLTALYVLVAGVAYGFLWQSDLDEVERRGGRQSNEHLATNLVASLLWPAVGVFVIGAWVSSTAYRKLITERDPSFAAEKLRRDRGPE